MSESQLPLEDTFGDIVRKCMHGLRLDAAHIAEATGIDRAAILGWTQRDEPASEQEARVIARVLKLDPGRLADSAAARWYPSQTETPHVRRHAQAPHPSNGYVFFLDGAKRAALVDPAGIGANLLRILRAGAYHLQYILITHKHADHCDATADVAAAFPDAKIVMHSADVAAIGSLGSRATLLRDGEALPFGEDAKIRMLHTPGHTDGSSAYLFESTLFTGDTLFAGSVGGAYGDASTYNDILNNIRSKFFALPDEVAVMPGHGPPSTIAQEKEHNPFF